ncbi:MAG: c-type cytochrome [Gammaproteobacteria bacterium]|nr:c-type cytochrome [Gammaproteobacteria bacterium]MDH5591365.1 c-type cytochrome [Gammaproteobacteria bacterium]
MMFKLKSAWLLVAALTMFTSAVIADEGKLATGTEAPIGEQDKYASVQETLKTCFSCHGEKGASTIGTFPTLAGQEFYYMYVQLKDMKKGLRASQVMGPIVAGIEKEDLKLMAEYFSEQEWPKTDYKLDPKRIAAAKLVADAGQCAACHLGTFKGNSRVPRLANQHPEYLKNTMHDFKNDVRKNAPAMGTLFKSFSEQEIQDIADYMSSFKGE